MTSRFNASLHRQPLRLLLISCFGSDVLRQKTLVFRSNAEQSKLTALNDYGKNVHNILQAAQGPALRWLFCEITVISYDKVVTISSWDQVYYLHLTNFQTLILWNSVGITTSCFNASLKRQPLRLLNVELGKCWLDAWEAAFWDRKPSISETRQNKVCKLTALNDNGKIALKTLQVAQGPAVRWSSCEITDRAELLEFVWNI